MYHYYIKTFMILLTAILGADIVHGITLEATDSGFFNAEGRNAKYDGTIVSGATYNYSVGYIDEVAPLSGSDVHRKNFFVFDLSGITDPIASATLSLFNPAGTPGGYDSPDSSEVYAVGGLATTDPVAMAAFATDLSIPYDPTDTGPGGEREAADMIFSELAASLLVGDVIGDVVVSDADDGTTIDITFTPFGISYLQTFKGGVVVLGGEVPTPDGIDAGDEVIFGFTETMIGSGTTPTPTLTITTIPEPASITIMALAASIAWRKRTYAKSL